MKEKEFLGKRYLVITAHPDDESFICAGTVHKNQLSGGQTILVCATMGERGVSRMKEKLTTPEVKALRKKELQNAASLLGISQLYLYDFPDGELESHKQDFLQKLRETMPEIKVDVILGFGPDGMSGHLDHIVSGEVAKQLAKEVGLPGYCFCMAPDLAQSAAEKLEARRVYGKYAEKIIYQKPTVRVEIDPEIKMKALRAHKSQIGDDPFSGLPGQFSKEFFKAEYFCDMI